MTDYVEILHTKPYVKAYLENRFGAHPCKLQGDRDLLKVYRAYSTRGEYKMEPAGKMYSEKVRIFISQDSMDHYGSIRTNKDQIRFGLYCEQRIKMMMRNYVSLQRSIGVQLKVAIMDFQDRFGYPESVWSFESIKKDYTRWGDSAEVGFGEELKEKITSIFLGKLSSNGTLIY